MKKTLMAVSALILVATLCTGAGMAATASLGTAFYYQDLGTDAYTGTYYYGPLSINISDDGIIMPSSEIFAEGLYKCGDEMIDIKLPRANYQLNGETYFVKEESPFGWRYGNHWQYPTGIVSTKDRLILSVMQLDTLAPAIIDETILCDESGNIIAKWSGEFQDRDVTADVGVLKPGRYTLSSVFNATCFAESVPVNILTSGPVSFRVADPIIISKPSTNVDLGNIYGLSGSNVTLNLGVTDLQSSEPAKFRVDVLDSIGNPVELSLSAFSVTIKGENFDRYSSKIFAGIFPIPIKDGFSVALPMGGFTSKITLSGEIVAIDPSMPVSLEIKMNGVSSNSFSANGTQAVISLDNLDKISDGAQLNVSGTGTHRQEFIVAKEIQPSPATPTSSINLSTGWNFISVPKYLSRDIDTAGELFAALATGDRLSGVSPLGYDASSAGGWYVLSRDTPIKPLDGYWVYVEEPSTLNLSYASDDPRSSPMAPPSKPVYCGWNAVGLCAKEPMSAKSTFAYLSWVRYLPWDLNTDTWSRVIVNGGSAADSEENYVMLGNGGWLYVEADGVLLGNTA